MQNRKRRSQKEFRIWLRKIIIPKFSQKDWYFTDQKGILTCEGVKCPTPYEISTMCLKAEYDNMRE
ncbi:hypothetical protein Lal_00044754 [Lupinus albus]|nr:hypothetical protein Lal_00044754 [Lupinus albus]